MSKRKSQIIEDEAGTALVELEIPDYAELYQVLVKYDVQASLAENVEEIADWILQIIGLTIYEKLPVKGILKKVVEAGKKVDVADSPAVENATTNTSSNSTSDHNL